MSLYAFKPRFQSLLRPLVHLLHRAGVSANQVTLTTAAVSILLGIGVATQAEHTWVFLLIPVWFALRMALNAVDGMLAREHAQASVLGAYLNELCDVVSDVALYLPFAFLPGASAGMVATVAFLAVLTEFAGVLGVAVGASRRYDGPLGKSDRGLVFGALGLAAGFGALPAGWFTPVLIAMIVLLVLTVLNRVRNGLAEARERGER